MFANFFSLSPRDINSQYLVITFRPCRLGKSTKDITISGMSWRKVLISILVFLVIFAVYFLVVTSFYPDMTKQGQFGDMFGGLNAFFSGLAFLGVIYAIILQREELSLQRGELELTRKELGRTAKAQEESVKALSKQAESLKATAKLNALGAQLGYQSSLIEAVSNDSYSREAHQIAPNIQKEAERIVAEIRTLTENK